MDWQPIAEGAGMKVLGIADGKMIAFVHPKSTGGTLIELCQDA